ncbi:MAG: DUF3037 domain-containing protein [Saprospiraceae bacterium]|nr:DUF3037 domain-containing protein [Saprospiraceae bacterium]
MPGQFLFEYSILRYVPKVERGEQINLAVVLYCKEKDYLDMRYHIDADRVRCLFGDADLQLLEMHMRSVRMICRGDEEAVGLPSMPMSYRFRWIAAHRSTIIQSSPLHPGMCDDPEAQLERLFGELVR